jgi:hypothetical protein
MKQTRSVKRLVWVAVLLLAVGSQAGAFTLGIALDAFLGQLETAMVGLGLIIFVAGGIGTTLALMENTYAQYLTAYLGLFVKGGILGGLSTLGGAVGLLSGAILLGVG